MSALATKQQSQKIFEKLKTKQANKVTSHPCPWPNFQLLRRLMHCAGRYALTVVRTIQLGRPSLLVSIYASIVLRTTETSVCTFPLCVPRTSIVRSPNYNISGLRALHQWELTALRAEWKWEQLRIMKVGGNESATKFFRSNGGSAALASKDPKTKYQSPAATKYKEELKKRAARDALE
jgi:ADP-ribosylation factor GTPase-activating protein 2/3